MWKLLVMFDLYNALIGLDRKIGKIAMNAFVFMCVIEASRRQFIRRQIRLLIYN